MAADSLRNAVLAGLRRPRPTLARQVPNGIVGVELASVETDVGQLWFPAADQVMLPYLAKTGTWEADEGELLRSLARPGCRFLDVGANVGYFSLFIGQAVPDARIDAVEPNPLLVSLLRINLWAADVDAEVWPLALGNRSGALALETAATNYGDGRVMRDREGSVATTVVPIGAGDELFGGRSFDLVKIDVQGAELDVVHGLEQTIRRSPGISVVTEFWPTAIVERGDDPLATLAAYRRIDPGTRMLVNGQLRTASDGEILALCTSGGVNGQVNLLLTP